MRESRGGSGYKHSRKPQKYGAAKGGTHSPGATTATTTTRAPLGGSSPPSPPTTTRTPPPASPQPSFVGLLRLAAVRRQVVPNQVDRNEGIKVRPQAVFRRPRATRGLSLLLGGVPDPWRVPGPHGEP